MYLVLKFLVPHFANVKGHMTPISSGWALLHAALLRLFHCTVSALLYGLNPKREAWEILVGNKLARLCWPISDILDCTLSTVLFPDCIVTQWDNYRWIGKQRIFQTLALSLHSLTARYSGKEVIDTNIFQSVSSNEKLSLKTIFPQFQFLSSNIFLYLSNSLTFSAIPYPLPFALIH